MPQIDRRAAIAAYKERPVRAGIYAVRCPAAGAVWVGQVANLDGIANRVWFSLRHGGHGNRRMQRAWQSHGAESFALDVLEILADEESPYLRGRQLKARLAHWQAHLGADLA